VHPVKVGIALEDPLPADLLAYSHAAAAHDAEVVVAVEEGLSQNRHIPELELISDLLQADELDRLLQLAGPIPGAELAAHGHRKLPHALPQVGAIVLSIAEKA